MEARHLVMAVHDVVLALPCFHQQLQGIVLQVVEPVVDSSRYFALRIEDPVSKRHAFIGIGFRERTEASDFNAALYEHTQYLRRKKEALEMREAYESTADETGSSASLSQSSFSLKPGETITLKLAKTQLSPPASGTQPLSRLGSASAQLPRFQSATATSGQIPLLAPPPANSPGPTLARLSGAPGSSGKQTDDSADTDKASSSTADDATATASSAKHQEEGGMHDVSTHAEPGSAQDMHAQTDKQLQETASAEQSKQLNHMQPAIDDWGDFVS
ncbi:TPA: hypothetical protein ACH3X1_004162 [Trebouxia sp. C0004]